MEYTGIRASFQGRGVRSAISKTVLEKEIVKNEISKCVYRHSSKTTKKLWRQACLSSSNLNNLDFIKMWQCTEWRKKHTSPRPSKQEFCLSPLSFRGFSVTLELTLSVPLGLTFLCGGWGTGLLSFVLRAEAQQPLSPGNLLEMDCQAPGDLEAH